MLEKFDIDLIKFENIHRKFLEIYRKSKKFYINFSPFHEKSALIDVYK